MESFSLVEADFQQFYNIDLEEYCQSQTGFLRYARLFSELPSNSRVMKKLWPIVSWEWNDEVQSRILYKLDTIAATLYNTNRKKGQKAQQVEEQFEPDYVKQAKKDFEEAKRQEEADIEQAKDFWQARNPNVKMS